MPDLRDTALGLIGIPLLAGGAVAVWPRAVPAMAVSPEWAEFYAAQHRVQDRRLMAYVLGGTAVASLLLSQTRAVGEHGQGIAEGGAMGAAIAAVLAYALSLQAERSVPPRPDARVDTLGVFGAARGEPRDAPLPATQRTMMMRPDELGSPSDGWGELEVPQLGAGAGTAGLNAPRAEAHQAVFESLVGAVVYTPYSKVYPRETPLPDRGAREPAAVLGSPFGSVLTGEAPPDPTVVQTVLDRHAAMDRYYREEWRPRQPDPASLPLTLPITSHVRPFARQAGIVADQLRLLGAGASSSELDLRRALLQILTTRSIPGHSRHHWGTDIDIVDTDAGAWKPGGQLERLLPFVREEAGRFGFFNPYRDGAFPEPTKPHYNDEPWHLSYAPIADVYMARWVREDLPSHPALLDRAAAAIAPAAGVDQGSLRAALGSIDLPSYVTNVAPAPTEARV